MKKALFSTTALAAAGALAFGASDALAQAKKMKMEVGGFEFDTGTDAALGYSSNAEPIQTGSGVLVELSGDSTIRGVVPSR